MKKKYAPVPKPVDTTEIRIVDLTKDGFPFLPAFAHTHYSRTGTDTTPHRHEGFIEVFYCIKGDRTTCEHEGVDVDFRPGDVFVAQPEHYHYLKTHPKGFRLYWFRLKLINPDRQFPMLNTKKSREVTRRLRALPVRFTGGDQIGRLFRAVWKNIDTPYEPLRSVRLSLAIHELLLGLIDAAAQPELPRVSSTLKELLAEMRAHPEKSWPAQELTRRLGINATYLNQYFKRACGLPPCAHLKSLRIEKAKRLLASGKHSVASIATQVGFSSPKHFATQFRKETGTTPRLWNKKPNTTL